MSHHGQNRSNLAILPKVALNQINKGNNEEKFSWMLILGKNLTLSGSFNELIENT